MTHRPYVPLSILDSDRLATVQWSNFSRVKNILRTYEDVSCTDAALVYVKRQAVLFQDCAKIVGITIDFNLQHRQHAANAASKSISAAIALRRLLMLLPFTERQLSKPPWH